MSLSEKKKVKAPAKSPRPVNPLPLANFMDSKINSKLMAEINVPAPNPRIIPMVRLLKVKREVNRPPNTREEVASNPQRNEFNILVDG
jgi:hypothetical protein